MRRDIMNNLLFHARLPHQAEAPLGQIPHAAMKQAAGATAGAEREIVLLNQSNPQTSHGRVAGHS
jgi:hypothetical protein